MRRLITPLTILLVACCAGLSARAAEPTPFVWERSTPEAQGLDSRVFLEGLKRLKEEQLDLHSLIVIRNDRIVLELYVHPYDRDTLHNVKSVSKSVISAVIGIALERGILPDLDRPVHQFFPDYFPDGVDPRKKKITLRHLVSMTSGLDLDENGPIMGGIFDADDWIRATFERPMAAEPGAAFLYSTPLTHTMSGVLTETSGKSLLELTTGLLFEPLGIEPVQWTQGPRGYYFGGAEMFLRPIDMARFGSTILHGGRWRGRQIVPAGWVHESTRNQIAATGSDDQYGYGWWTMGGQGYAAMGWGGQAIRMMPEANLVIVGTASDPGAIDQMFRGFQDYEPSDEPLPPNPEAVEEVEKLVRELRQPTPGPVPEPPALAKSISGRQYVLETNRQGFTHLRLDFLGGDTCRMSLGTPSGDFDFPVGLDGVFRLVDTGSYGTLPDGENRFAHRAIWTDATTLTVESVNLGNPNQARAVYTFDGDEVDVRIAVRPLGREFELKGRAEPAPVEAAGN